MAAKISLWRLYGLPPPENGCESYQKQMHKREIQNSLFSIDHLPIRQRDVAGAPPLPVRHRAIGAVWAPPRDRGAVRSRHVRSFQPHVCAGVFVGSTKLPH